MFDTLIQVAAGWVLPFLFFWVLLSFLASAITEWVSNVFKWHTRMLESQLNLMLGNELSEKFWKHGFFPDRQQRPAKITENVFTQIILNWVVNGIEEKKAEAADDKPDAQNINSNISAIKSKSKYLGDILELSPSILPESNSDSARLSNIEKNLKLWFVTNMVELKRKYQRRNQLSLIIIGIVVATYLNFDVIALTSQLWKSAALKESVTAGAVITNPIDTSLPIFWLAENTPTCQVATRTTISMSTSCFAEWITKILGILIGGILIAIGSPIIYDLRKGKKT